MSRSAVFSRLSCILVLWLVLWSGGVCMAEEPALTPPGGDAPLDVTVALFVIDLVKLDAADQSAEIDFMLSMSWRDPRLIRGEAGPRVVDPEEIWVPQVLPVQGRRFLSAVWEGAVVDGDGRVTLRRRYAGPISAPLGLSDFPFDSHLLKMSFAASGLFERQARLELDESLSGQAASFSVPDWRVGQGRVLIEPFVVNALDISLPGFAYELPVARRSEFHIWGVIAPLVAIIAMSWAVFWLTPAYVTQKLSIATTAILTLIAYRFALGTQLPKLSYLTRMDIFIFGATLLIFVAFVKVVVEAGLVHGQREATALRIDAVCRWLFPILLLGLIGYSFWS